MVSSQPNLCREEVVSLLEAAAGEFLTPANPDFPYASVYASLQPQATTTFRVVRLLAGSGSDRIKCELIPSCLGSTALSYDAMSYCAGEADDCQSIILDGHEFNTFRSIFEALCTFRHAESSRHLWIDQICINQTNTEERDGQVLLMRQIYKHAARTQIWLGEAAADPPTSLAFGLLDDFLRANRDDLRDYIVKVGVAQTGYTHTGDSIRDYLHAEAQWYRHLNPPQIRERVARRSAGRQDDTMKAIMQWFDTACNDSSYLKSWYALFHLLERPWWRRSWIVQEVAVSGEVIVSCGSSSIVWEDLSLLFEAWYVICEHICRIDAFHDVKLQESMRSCTALQHRIHILRRTSGEITFESYLGILRGSLASDPRDKVYSILGMFTDRQRLKYGITPSYASGNMTADVYFAAAEAILSHDADLSLLTCTSGREIEAGLPSWVPDWSSPALAVEGSDIYKTFDAGIGRRVELEVLKPGRELALRGYMVDSIRVVGSVDNGGDSIDLIAAWQALFVSNSQCKVDLDGLHSFYRAVGFDRWTSIPDPDGDLEEFKSDWAGNIDWHRAATIKRSSREWCFFVSDTASPGMAPRNAKSGDMIFIPWGSRMPFAIRRFGDGPDHYQLAGLCYLHGMMYGEAIDLENEGQVKDECIYLV